MPLAFEGDGDDRAALIAALERLAGGKPDDAPETVVVRGENPAADPEPEGNVAVVSDGCGPRPDLRRCGPFARAGR